MRAGSLDRLIAIEHAAAAVSDAGTPIKTWAVLRNVWAQMLQSNTGDRDGAGGAATEQSLTFRIRWFDGLTLEHRVVYSGQTFEIKSIREIGRREGYDVSCKRVGP